MTRNDKNNDTERCNKILLYLSLRFSLNSYCFCRENRSHIAQSYYALQYRFSTLKEVPFTPFYQTKVINKWEMLGTLFLTVSPTLTLLFSENHVGLTTLCETFSKVWYPHGFHPTREWVLERVSKREYSTPLEKS